MKKLKNKKSIKLHGIFLPKRKKRVLNKPKRKKQSKPIKRSRPKENCKGILDSQSSITSCFFDSQTHQAHNKKSRPKENVVCNGILDSQSSITSCFFDSQTHETHSGLSSPEHGKGGDASLSLTPFSQSCEQHVKKTMLSLAQTVIQSVNEAVALTSNCNSCSNSAHLALSRAATSVQQLKAAILDMV